MNLALSRRPLGGAILAAIAALLTGPTASAQRDSFGGPPINYLKTDVHDPVAKLAERIEAGEAELSYEGGLGYLQSVLEELDIPVSSQTLVFSKTSLQLHRISRRRPRAIYFSDDVYVGFCQGGEVLELAATDPQQGAIFYSLRQTDEQPPKFVRDRGQCLTCHASSRTQDVPGYLVRSVFANRIGRPILGSGTFTTDHTSPFSERWGGWYVTGEHGQMRHMGNITYTEGDEQGDRDRGANVQSLDEFVSTDPYPSPHSDLVALMVLEHQTQMHNAIAAANYETRQALHQSYQMNELLDRDPGHISDSANRRIDAAAEQVVSYLLMCDEFQLESPVSGTSGFAEEFAARGVRDGQGRSLRELDLSRRLFRYPCSYLVHSAAFAGLPDEVRGRIITRVIAILKGEENSPQSEHLTAPLRRDILEILRATHPEFAAGEVLTEARPGDTSGEAGSFDS